ncbi:glycosyltransferase [uncultured Duncaniella sp.]|uniref:glycosyltransferase n=2 Tax=uncultured Duncaniella sp. TaxID=2768039 RepID=UPI0026283BED|nr:glycosyltransferase [uncultured Duncaniella sp.]
MSGEEHASREIVDLLKEHDHDVKWFTRTSAEISNSFYGKLKALIAGIYNPYSAHRLSKILDDFKPDIVQVQNLYPLISPSIFKPLKKRNIPVVMRCPNYRLFCPSGLSLDPSGNVCERCWKGDEWNCVKYNCLGSYFKSIGYSLRNSFSRIFKLIINSVDVFIVQSEFQKKKFIVQGIPSHKIGILSGISPIITKYDNWYLGEFVSFVGRVSKEKGIYEFIEAAKLNPDIPFKVAGNLDENFEIPQNIPSNLEFVGFKKGCELDKFYMQSRIIVVPSKWYEGFPNVIVRGMLIKKPVITTSIGAMQSIINHKENGLLVSPGNAIELAKAIQSLYWDSKTCTEYGLNGFNKANSLYSRERIYTDLSQIYLQAQKNAATKK